MMILNISIVFFAKKCGSSISFGFLLVIVLVSRQYTSVILSMTTYYSKRAFHLQTPNYYP